MGWLPPSLTASRCASVFLVQATNGKDGNHEYRYDDWCGSGKVCFPGSRGVDERRDRSEEHTSELQSLMRISYAVFCLKKKRYKANNRQKTKSSKYIRINNSNKHTRHTANESAQ